MTFFLLLSRSQVELGDALIEDDTEEAHHGRAGQQERNEDELALSAGRSKNAGMTSRQNSIAAVMAASTARRRRVNGTET